MSADPHIELSNEEKRNAILELLNRVRVLTLATAMDNKPWACTLAYAFDADLNIYCITNKETRHVLEIDQNQDVSVAIHEHQSPNYNPKTVKGLQMEATATLLSGVEVVKALKVFVDRFPLAEAMSKERLFELKSARIIQIRPKKLFFLDREIIGKRVELDLT